MKKKHYTEKVWSGKFGNQYIDRNKNEELLKSKTIFFKKIIKNKYKIKNAIEFGCNIGLNFQAIKNINNKINHHGVEINKQAVDILKKKKICKVYHSSIFDFETKNKFDLTFTKGVLIHVPPKFLKQSYQKLYNYTNKYILIAEYYNPIPKTIKYRGHNKILYKRDFAKDLMELYEDLQLIDYGFVYRNDPTYPLDDINWFLFKKK